MNTKHAATTELASVGTQRTHTPSEQILAPLDLSDYSQFLYDTNFSGVKGQDFTAEGIKTLGLNNGISTSDVRVEFLNDEKTEALFYCRATDCNGHTSQRVVKQTEKENGRINPNWIEKGIARAERNAIKARLPVQLFKTALQNAIATGQAEQSAIVEAQRQLGVAWCERDEALGNIDKRVFYQAAQREYGDNGDWGAETWEQVTADLKAPADWVTQLTQRGC